MITLLQLRRCPWAAAVRQALDNVGQDYGVVQVPYDRSLRHRVRDLTGQEMTPVLLDGETVLTDSREIVAHIYDAYGDVRQRERAAELRREPVFAGAACAVGS